MNLAEGNIVADHYKLLKRLGNGSFGDVWLAHDELADIDVAVKFYGTLDMNGLEEFRNEFKITYKLRHPNLLNINHFDIYENCPYLVMPYCAKGSANNRIGQMSESELWKFILDVSSGLSYLHSQQPPIVHQDIKPENILITGDDRYVIADFGISKSFRTRMSRTNNGYSSSGTIAYMGPERFSEEPMIVLASDIWAFGMTLYELITGDVLWEGMGGCVQLNGARIPAIKGNYSQELLKLIPACLAAETWNRPTAVQINNYASAYLQKQPLPKIFAPESTSSAPEHPTVDPVPHPSEPAIVRNNKKEPVSLHKPARNIERSGYIPKQQETSQSQGNLYLKRGLFVAAAMICGILLITGITKYVNAISEEHEHIDFISCKSIDDYKQFIKDHPTSSYAEEARQRIISMTAAPAAPAAPVTTPVPQAKKQEEIVKVKSEPVYIKEKEKTASRKVETIEKPQPVAPTTVRQENPYAADDRAFYSCATATDYHNYLSNFPNGRHRAEASNILSGLVSHSNTRTNHESSGAPDASALYDRGHADVPPAGSRGSGYSAGGSTSSSTSIHLNFGGAGRSSASPGRPRGGSSGGGSRSSGGSRHRHGN